MTLQEFIAKYLNKFVEYHSFSSGAKNQCVDLANQYIVEVLGLPAIIGTNAQDFPTKRGNNFEWIVNTPEGLPKAGDLMIFKSADGVGHISIFVEGNLSLFRSFDQNYPTGSPCKIVQHNYRNVLGWLTPIMPENNELQTCMTDRAKFWKERDEAREKLAKEIANNEATKGELSEVRTSHNQFLQSLATKLVCLADEANILGTIDRLLEVEDQLTKSRKDYSQLEKNYYQLEQDKNKEIEKLGDELSTLRKDYYAIRSEVAQKDAELERLGNRIEELLALPQEKPILSHLTGFSRLIKSIKSILRRLLWR